MSDQHRTGNPDTTGETRDGGERHTKAVILARGLGTRMKKDDTTAELDAEQAKAAGTGVKAMIPTLGRPFLDFVLASLAEAGYRKVCLVIGPEHGEMRQYYGQTLATRRLEISFAVQERPLGTADAVRPAETFAAGEPFLMINSDNYYPPAALAGLARSPAPAVAAFDRDALLAGSNIPPERIGKFSVVLQNADGTMARIIEKPDAATLAGLTGAVRVSMNCWLFDQRIFRACDAIGPSPRGEYEITDAVQHCISALGQRFHVVPVAAPVLDMSSRGDIAGVAEHLKAVPFEL